MLSGASRPLALLGAGLVFAAVAFDPSATAAEAKQPLLLFVTVAALALSLARIATSPRKVRVAPATLLFAAFAAASLASLAWGAPLGRGHVGSLVAASAIALCFGRGSAAEARRRASFVALAIGGAASIFALVEAALGGRGMAIHGGQGNPNWLGLLLAATLPLSVYAVIEVREKRGILRVFALLFAALHLPALALSHARVGLLAVAIAMTIWAFVARKTLARASASLAALVAALVAAGGVLLALALSPASPEAPRAFADAPVGAVDRPALEAWEGRVWIFRASLDAAAKAMPLGAGAGSFAEHYLDAQGARLASLSPSEASRRFLNATTAHNDYLDAAVEGGALGLLLLVATLGCALVSALRSRFFAGAASLGAIAIAALGDSPLAQPAVLVVFAVLLSGLTPRSIALPRRVAIPLLGAALVASALLLPSAIATYVAARRVTEAERALPAARSTLLNEALRIDPDSGEAALARGLARLDEGDAAGARGDLNRSRALLANVGTDVAIGNAELLLGDAKAADEAYARALSRHPGSFRAHANRALARARLGDAEGAESHLAIARSLWPGNPKLRAIEADLQREKTRRATSL